MFKALEEDHYQYANDINYEPDQDRGIPLEVDVTFDPTLDLEVSVLHDKAGVDSSALVGDLFTQKDQVRLLLIV